MLDYNIRLSGIKEGDHKYSFIADDNFFASFKDSEIKKAKFHINVILKKRNEETKFSLKIRGDIFNIVCDICATNLCLPISCCSSYMIIQSNEEIGGETIDDHHNICFVDDNQYEINIAQLIFETIVLSLPIKRTHNHQNEKCDESMLKLLNRYSNKEKNSDSRWEKLKHYKI